MHINYVCVASWWADIGAWGQTKRDGGCLCTAGPWVSHRAAHREESQNAEISALPGWETGNLTFCVKNMVHSDFVAAILLLFAMVSSLRTRIKKSALIAANPNYEQPSMSQNSFSNLSSFIQIANLRVIELISHIIRSWLYDYTITIRLHDTIIRSRLYTSLTLYERRGSYSCCIQYGLTACLNFVL